MTEQVNDMGNMLRPPRGKRHALLSRCLSAVLLVVVLVFVSRYIWLRWPELSKIAFRLSVPVLAGGFLVFAGAMLLLVHVWRSLLGLYGESLKFSKALMFFFVSQLGKYVPGKVWAFAGRVALCTREGLSVLEASASVLYEQVFLLLSAAIVGLLGVVFLPPKSTQVPIAALTLGGLAVFVIAHPAVIRRGFAFACRILKRDPVPFRMKTAQYLGMLGWYLSFQVLAGFSFFLVAKSFAALSWELLPSFVSVYALAWAAGFIAFFAPAGLGVREGIMLALLSGIVEPQVAIAATVTHRLIVTGVEIVGAGIGWAILRWMPSTPAEQVANRVQAEVRLGHETERL